MRKSFLTGLLVILGCAVAGAAAGWLLAPRYTPPADDGEARLRARATEYYRALQTKDLWTINRLYSPARQVADRDDLVKLAEYEAGLFERFQDKTKEQLRGNAAGILPENLEVEIDGDWAVTSGVLIMTQEEQEIPVPLGEMSWVRTGGDWWIYIRRPSELNAYGNPPDAVLAVAKEQNSAQRRVVQQYEVSLDEDADGAETDAESGDETAGSAAEPEESGDTPAEDAADAQNGADAADNPEEDHD